MSEWSLFPGGDLRQGLKDEERLRRTSISLTGMSSVCPLSCGCGQFWSLCSDMHCTSQVSFTQSFMKGTSRTPWRSGVFEQNFKKDTCHHPVLGSCWAAILASAHWVPRATAPLTEATNHVSKLARASWGSCSDWEQLSEEMRKAVASIRGHQKLCL